MPSSYLKRHRDISWPIPCLPRPPAGRTGRRRGGARRECSGGLEQLDRIAGRIVDEDLPSAPPGHDLAAEPAAGALQPRDGGRQVVELELDSIPAARHGLLAVGHGLSGAAGAEPTEQQLQLAFGYDRESGIWTPLDQEAEFLVEGDRPIHVVHDIADIDLGHACTLPSKATWGSTARRHHISKTDWPAASAARRQRQTTNGQPPSFEVTPFGRPTTVTRRPGSSRRLATRWASASVTASMRAERRSI